MSRSRKKPVITQQNSGKPGVAKQAKRQANRAVRAANKRAVEDAADELADGKAYRKASNSWDIRDWSFYDPNAKARRK